LSLSLPLSYGWRPKGNPLRVPKHWGAAGRINIIGTLACIQDTEQLEYRVLEERCYAQHVKTYLEALAQEAERLSKEVVVILDNAGFHRAKLIKDQQDDWEARGLTLWFQPPYSPQFNLIETVWKKLKGFLLPRRCYDTREQLLKAVLAVLELLGAKAVSHSYYGNT
jgi:putative transposase